MSVTSAVEDYLKAVYALGSRGLPVTTSGVAAELGVAAPSASAMVKRLRADGLVERDAAPGIALTAEGRRLALRVVRRHRLLETFLSDVLGLAWDEVHAEAERLEHAVSDRLEDRIDAVLGHPTRDPHGDPIPPRQGEHEERWGEPLATAAEGARFRVERVSDRDSGALRHLAELGIRPRAVVTVEERAPYGGPLWVAVDGTRHAVGVPLAHLVHGTVLDGADSADSAREDAA